MVVALRVLLPAASVLCVVLGSAPSAAAPPKPVVVLDIDSEDAEDEAEALTVALRSRVRMTPGWRLTETREKPSTLFVALQCPPKPDAVCLQRIANQLRADRFVWGTMTRVDASRVQAEVHLWTKNTAEIVVKESYSANLKDAGDEPLRRIVHRMVDKLSGVQAGWVHATVEGLPPGATATVFVEDTELATLPAGEGRFLAPVGNTRLELRAPGVPSYSEVVVVPPTDEAQWNVNVGSEGATARPSPAGFPTWHVVTYGTLLVGAAAAAVSIAETVHYASARSSLTTLLDSVPPTVTDVCSFEAEAIPEAVVACRKVKETSTARDVALATGIGAALLLGTGAVLHFTGMPKKDHRPTSTPTTARVRVEPRVSPVGGGLWVLGSF